MPVSLLSLIFAFCYHSLRSQHNCSGKQSTKSTPYKSNRAANAVSSNQISGSYNKPKEGCSCHIYGNFKKRKIMIKRILIALIAVFSISSTASARDTYARDASVLPKAAQVVLAKNFKAGVNLVKIDKTLGRVSEYEVVLTDGTEVTFDRNGNWENIEIGTNGRIPAAFVPAPISQYVKKTQKGAKIVGIDRESSGYEVELSNGIDMKFDKNGRFLRYDD